MDFSNPNSPWFWILFLYISVFITGVAWLTYMSKYNKKYREYLILLVVVNTIIALTLNAPRLLKEIHLWKETSQTTYYKLLIIASSVLSALSAGVKYMLDKFNKT